jgi:S1-C subfamily serine protease
MRLRNFLIAVCLMIFSISLAACAGDGPVGQSPHGPGDDPNLPNGVVGISLQMGAERIGDPAVLYVAMVHPEGPARQAGVVQGEEIQSVDGNPVIGKSYEQVVRMIRGEAGTVVKLGVKGAKGTREVVLTRVAGDQLSKVPRK